MHQESENYRQDAVTKLNGEYVEFLYLGSKMTTSGEGKIIWMDLGMVCNRHTAVVIPGGCIKDCITFFGGIICKTVDRDIYHRRAHYLLTFPGSPSGASSVF